MTTRNAIWSYVRPVALPVMGPDPRLAVGSGHTAVRTAAPGFSTQLPSNMTEQSYEASPFTYQAPNDENFQKSLPRTIGVGTDGRGLVGTYVPHDTMHADRFATSTRSAAPWQVQAFPPNFRQLLEWQQVQRYRVNSLTQAARPLTRSDYFLGYRLDPTVAAQIGGFTGNGFMGSN